MRPESQETSSVEETIDVARRLGASLRGGDVVHLEGELGTGKTHFVKGLAAGLGIDPDDVRSPTFTFIDVHAPGSRGLGLVHADLYRVAVATDLTELGLEELPGPDQVLAIEWPERLAPGTSPPSVRVVIADLGGSRRRVETEKT